MNLASDTFRLVDVVVSAIIVRLATSCNSKYIFVTVMSICILPVTY